MPLQSRPSFSAASIVVPQTQRIHHHVARIAGLDESWKFPQRRRLTAPGTPARIPTRINDFRLPPEIFHPIQ